MGYKKNDPCLTKAYDDERLFVLVTRDNTAPEVVMEWIKLNLRKQPAEKLLEAFECALEMVNKEGTIKRRVEIDRNEWAKQMSLEEDHILSSKTGY